MRELLSIIVFSLASVWFSLASAQTTVQVCSDESAATLGEDRNDWTADNVQSQGYMTDIPFPEPGPNANGCDPVWTSVNICIDLIEVSTNGNAACNLQGVYGNIWLDPPPMMDGCMCGRDTEILGGAGWSTGQVCLDLAAAGFDFSNSTAIGVDVIPAVDPNTNPDCPTTAAIDNGFITNVEFDICIDFTYVYPALPDAGEDVSIFCGNPVTLGANPIYTATTSAPAVYAWSNGENGALSSGNNGQISVAPAETTTYTVTVTESNGCTGTDEVTVTVESVSMADAGEDVLICDGGAAIIGGSPVGADGDSYQWSSGESGTIGPSDNGQISVIPMGNTTYTVTITDNNGCSSSDEVSVMVNQANPVAVSAAMSQQQSDCDLPDGSAQAAASGGSPPYTFLWNTSPMQTGDTATGLIAGNYQVTVTDANGCTAETSVSVTSTFDITTVADITPVDCNGNATGGIALSSNGDNPPFSYSWNVGMGNPNVGLAAGIYTVTTTDASGCQRVDTYTVDEPAALSVSLESVTDAACADNANGAISAEVSGGVAPYTYTWSGEAAGQGNPATNLGVGVYDLLVTDANGCEGGLQAEVAYASTLEIDTIFATAVSCAQDCDGAAEVALSGGQLPFTYFWNNGNDSDTAAGLCEGVYTVTVLDADGCQVTGETVILPAVPMQMQLSATAPTCFGFDNGTISVSDVVGGTPPYSYSLDGLSFQQSGLFPNVAGGITTAYTQDANGCVIQESIVVTEPSEVTLSLVPADTLIQLGDSVRLFAITNPASLVDSLFWSPSAQLGCTDCLSPWAMPFQSTIYELTVMDANGCSASATAHVRVAHDEFVYIPNAFTPNGDGYNDFFNVFVGKGVARVRSLRVFDRWGGLVYSEEDVIANNAEVGWDGNYKGKAASPAVFIYMVEIEFLDGKVKIFKGDVALLR